VLLHDGAAENDGNNSFHQLASTPFECTNITHTTTHIHIVGPRAIDVGLCLIYVDIREPLSLTLALALSVVDVEEKRRRDK